MPSAKVLEQKKQIVEGLVARLNAACAGVIVDYKGITVTDDTALRKELREAGVEYTVVKNTLLRLAIKETELNGLESVLDGTTAIATSADDYVAAARILCKFADTHNGFEVKTASLTRTLSTSQKLLDLQNFPHAKFFLPRFSVLSRLRFPHSPVPFRLLLTRTARLLPQKKLLKLLQRNKLNFLLLTNWRYNYHVRKNYCYH